jgi:hypothetical protein
MTIDIKDLLSAAAPIGFTGSQGNNGFTGSQGIGFTGSAGNTGFTGSQGAVGFVGSQGSTGFVGSVGSIGFTGSRGFTGSQGIPGEAAAIGFTGSRGFNEYQLKVLTANDSIYTLQSEDAQKFLVIEEDPVIIQNLAAQDTPSGSGHAVALFGIKFSVSDFTRIRTVDILPTANVASDFIDLYDFNTKGLLDSVEFSGTQNIQKTIGLNFTLQPGTIYFIARRGTSSLTRTDEITNLYPFDEGPFSFLDAGNLAGSTTGVDRWYYFFNWTYSTNDIRKIIIPEDTFLVGASLNVMLKLEGEVLFEAANNVSITTPFNSGQNLTGPNNIAALIHVDENDWVLTGELNREIPPAPFYGTEVVATGGDTVDDVNIDGVLYRVHTFTSDGDFTVESGGDIEVLFVGAGGAATNSPTPGLISAPGGGGGGVVQGALSVKPGIYPIVVGLGNASTTMRRGGDTMMFAPGGRNNGMIIQAFGGGQITAGISAPNSAAIKGGSNSGVSHADVSPTLAPTIPSLPDGPVLLRSPTVPAFLGGVAQGNIGGAGRSGPAPFPGAGGGGGAGTAGGPGPAGNHNGGNGLEINFDGDPRYFAGGGGGSYLLTNFGIGGLGGADGGNPAASGLSQGQDGIGGGAGAPNDGAVARSRGGHGIAMIRYRI